ncbi:MAG: DeoR/GlpR family DNA-binding transcription regulator [Actinobacteria bacterium]|nr:DeoR/GlpR family DNA-binding transcription regulator [Actinomycetota bacterium]
MTQTTELGTAREEQGVPAELRQARIQSLVENEGFLRVTDLADRFGVSTVTVRSDLTALEGAGLVRRVRGGAVASGAPVTEQPLETAAGLAARQKSAIASRCASMVSIGDVVLLDVGSTTTAIAQALVARTELSDVTVVTNALNIALLLEPAAVAGRMSIIVTGGTVRPLQHSMVNPYATLLLERLSAHLAFIGCNGVDVRGGVTNRNVAEAEIKRAMVSASRRSVVVADSTKLGEVEVARVCHLGDVDLLVTDTGADPELVANIRTAGLHVDVVG